MSVQVNNHIQMESAKGVKDFFSTQGVRSEMNLRKALMIRLMLDDIHRISNPITPKRDTLYLRTQVRKQMQGYNKGYIEWGVHYAEVQEKGFRYDSKTGKKIEFKHYTTPGTHAHFAKESVDKVVNNADQYYYLGGLI